jgi:hypothetical protein
VLEAVVGLGGEAPARGSALDLDDLVRYGAGAAVAQLDGAVDARLGAAGRILEDAHRRDARVDEAIPRSPVI